MLTSEDRAPFVPVAKLSPPEGQKGSVSKRAVPPPPLPKSMAVNGGSAGGDPVPTFGAGGVLDFTAGSGSAEMMETAPPSSSVPDPPTTTSSSTSSSLPTSLYDYLQELIGEGLTLSLSAPTHCGGGSSQSHAPKSTKPLPDDPKTSSSAVTKHVHHSLENFLSREGFRPIRVQLPRRAPPPPSRPRGYYKGREPWTFSVPQAVLPVAGNPLEKHPHHRPPQQRQQRFGGGARKGACTSLLKHRHRNECPIDMAASWI